jgi:CubicO group peptidase (beta-lactamase class C family)
MFTGKETILQQILDEYTSKNIECGCQLAVYHQGKVLYNLVSGYTNINKTKKVTPQTIFPVFSAGKSVITILLLILYQEKVLNLDNPVSYYWKEFGQNGKEKITIRHILNHASGLHNPPEGLSFKDYYNWEVFTDALAKMAPQGTPGECKMYHGLTYGALGGKIAEAACNKSLQTLLEEKIFRPLKIDDIYFNLPKDKYSNLAQILDSDNNDFFLSHNEEYVLSGLNPSTNCCTNALALGKMYASLIDEGIDNVRLLNDETIEEAVSFAFDRENEFSSDKKKWKKFGLGFVRFGEIDDPFRLFGQTGAAGSEGIADRKNNLVMAFTKNKNIPGNPIPEVRNKIAEVLGLHERLK